MCLFSENTRKQYKLGYFSLTTNDQYMHSRDSFTKRLGSYEEIEIFVICHNNSMKVKHCFTSLD